MVQKNKSLGRILIGFALLSRVVTGMSAPSDSQDWFTNPVARSGADPWVIQHGGHYYYCQSHGGRGVWISKFDKLIDIGKSQPVCVWAPSPGKQWSKEIWAPELHYLRGKWFIYVAADDGDNNHHRMYTLEGTSQNPQAPFEFRGKLAALTDRWAIDGAVLRMPNERLYFIWSGWEGSNNIAQNLYIAPMSDPLTVSGERVCISRPEYDWEKRESPFVNEGPETLWHDGKLFIIYSASGSWADHYCLGQLTWNGGDVLNLNSWTKKATPVFSGTDNVTSPGHCSFVKSPDGKEDWIIYHTAKHPGAGWNRQVQMQKFDWSADGSPNFGKPVAIGVMLSLPGGDLVEAQKN